MIVSFGWFYETHVGHSLQGLIKVTDSSVQSYIFEKLRSQTTSEGHAAWCQQTWTFPLQSFVCAYIWSSLSRFQDPDSRTVLWVQWATRCTPPILPFRHRWLSYTWKRVGLREGWGGLGWGESRLGWEHIPRLHEWPRMHPIPQIWVASQRCWNNKNIITEFDLSVVKVTRMWHCCWWCESYKNHVNNRCL